MAPNWRYCLDLGWIYVHVHRPGCPQPQSSHLGSPGQAMAQFSQFMAILACFEPFWSSPMAMSERKKCSNTSALVSPALIHPQSTLIRPFGVSRAGYGHKWQKWCQKWHFLAINTSQNPIFARETKLRLFWEHVGVEEGGGSLKLLHLAFCTFYPDLDFCHFLPGFGFLPANKCRPTHLTSQGHV